MKTLLAIAALAIAWPASAQEAPAPDYGAMSDAELAEQLKRLESEGFFDACNTKVPLFAEVVRRGRDEEGARAGHLTAQAFCASERGRDDEGLRLLKQAEAIMPDLGLDLLGLYFAISLEDGAEAAARLRGLAQAGALADVDPSYLGYSLKALREDGLDDNRLAYDLARSASFADMHPDAQSTVAAAALGYVTRSGETAQVDELLSYVKSPYAVLDLLAFREYAPAWPAIEAYVGENLSKVTASYTAWTATRLADEPEDRDRLGDYSYALLFAGRFEEAGALAADWLGPPGSGRELQEGDAWALNTQVYALDALGRIGEADRIYEDLSRLPADEHPWVVNFVINRQNRLTEQGRWDESLAAGKRAREVADVHGSPYAKMLVASYHACALHKLGRADERDRELEFIREHFADAPTSAARALLCAERPDDAADLLARSLRDEVARDALLGDLQDERFDLFWSPSVNPSARDLVFERDELREEALRYIRVLPDTLVPVAYLRRQELAS